MPILLNKWDTLISTTLHPSKVNLVSPTDASVELLIYESEVERDKVQNMLIEDILNKPKIRDKQLYVQVNQAMLIRLLDKLYSYKQEVYLNETILCLYNSISQHLEFILNFIEDFFGNYFDRNEKVPDRYLIIAIKEKCRQLELLKDALKDKPGIEGTLKQILVNNFNKLCSNEKSALTYNELGYQKDLMNELLSDDTLTSETSIREVLFYFNFNDDSYVAYLYGKLISITEPLSTKKEKIVALRYEQKIINQLITKPYYSFSTNMPSLKEQINHWIEEEIKFLENNSVPEVLSKNDNEPVDKIRTTLSVAKLALLLRLMVIDKIITNRVIAHVLRIAVRTITTLQTDNIAFGSLETKYHDPDRGTISAVKDMLLRWINILNKL